MNQNIASAAQPASNNTTSDRLPWGKLLALAMAGFICILTETLPAGLLPQISDGLGISEALTGQLITLYALGSTLAAIPLITATRGWRRRRLLLMCLLVFLVFNTITSVSPNYILTLAARFFAGVSGGVVWGITAGYARRMVHESLRGRALAVAMIGSPLGLLLGVPIGTYIGGYIGWRLVFGITSLLSLLLIFWVLKAVPDFPGQAAKKRLPLRNVFFLPGIRSVLFVVVFWVLAHNVLYTYIAPFLAQAGLSGRIDLILFLFGIASVVGIWMIGMLIDHWLRMLTIFSLTGFAAASVLMGIFIGQSEVIYFSIVLWGLTFGGAGTLLQTALAEAAGENADVAQSMLVTGWNMAIGGGGIIGGILLETLGISNFPWVVLLLLLFALLITGRSKEHGFRAMKR
ncbi:MFS transporter [Brevibacillus reuszeri]|uniref:MFS transporter n=1 Tax=Brevibacillus reuszeri TaxID=54915 RepID=A0A0K9YPJ1_9BACL|nr:MFS transporter [Brevibacillus reuszeri]KNB70638.1 MFS transporter [Brevibacillus reuszeri]MED1861372.1 MFS transporter [Brevibacillus reuszeri]GED69913.1 MFS transporter [Brevibacillus reuszeri]